MASAAVSPASSLPHRTNDGAGPGGEKKKKKKRRAFGDETAVARDKRDRRIERAVEKGVRKREKREAEAAAADRASPSGESSSVGTGVSSRYATRSHGTLRSGATLRTGNRSARRRRGEGERERGRGSEEGSHSHSRSRGRGIKDNADFEDPGDRRRSLAETEASSSRRTVSTLGSSSGNPTPSKAEKKKKKTRRRFGDEVQVARDKREHKMEKAIVKEVVKQSKAIAREQAKTIVEEGAAASDTAGGASEMEKKTSKRTFKEEVKKARETVNIEKAIEKELIEKELESRRIERNVERERRHLKSLSFSRSKSVSRVASKHGSRHGERGRRKSCGSISDNDDAESISDVESLWRGGKFKATQSRDFRPPPALVDPLGRRDQARVTSSTKSLKTDSGTAVGRGLFPKPIRETLTRLDSMLSLAGSSVISTTSVRGLSELTTEVIEDAGHHSTMSLASIIENDVAHQNDSEILRNRPAKPSPRCRAMEEEIAQKKLEIIKASAEEKEFRHQFEKLEIEKERLVGENKQSHDRVRDANRTSKFLNDEVNRLRKNNAELIPVIKKMKIDVWRATRDRDDLRKMSYEMAGEMGQSEFFMKWRDWLSDDLMKEELSAVEDSRAKLARLGSRKQFSSLFA